MSSATIFALVLFILTYVGIFTLQKIRPVVALASGAVFVIVGSLGIFPDFRYTFFDALGQIDWNVLMMIMGTMGTVFLFIQSKMPQLLSDILVSRLHNVKALVVALSLFAGVISAFVDNVATVLMVAPVAIAICKKLKISPVPAIICISVSANLQGAATLVGDTTSILLAKEAGLDFMDFFVLDGRPGMFFVTECGALASTLVIWFMFRKETEKISISTRTSVEDKAPTLLLILTVATLIAASFIPYKENAAPGQLYKPDITNGIICLSYFAIGLIYEVVHYGDTGIVAAALKDIDYYTLGLLAGLFVVIGGITKAGIIELLGKQIASLSGDGSRMSIFLVYSVILWMSVLCSAFIDNIPYTATMMSVVTVVAEQINSINGAVLNPNLLYFGLLAGATLGGNLTPIGASANITSIGILRKEGYGVSSKDFMSRSVPCTLAAVVTGYILIWVIWM